METEREREKEGWIYYELRDIVVKELNHKQAAGRYRAIC